MKKIISYLITFLLGFITGFYIKKNRNPKEKIIGYVSNPRHLYASPYPDYTNDYTDIYFKTRLDAEIVLNELKKDTLKYDTVTVADYKHLSGITAKWSDSKYGWTNFDKARIYRGRDGNYYINLPTAIPIDEE